MTRAIAALALVTSVTAAAQVTTAAQTQEPTQAEARALNAEVLASPTSANLARRARAMRRAIIANPAAAKAFLLPPALHRRVQEQAPPDAEIESLTAFTTSPAVLIADSDDRRQSTHVYVFEDAAGGRVHAYQPSAEAPPIACGAEVRLSGYRLGDTMLATDVTPTQRQADAQPNCTPLGEHKVAALYLKVPGLPDPPPTLDQAKQQLFGTEGLSTPTFYTEGSYGQASISGDLFGPYTLDSTYTCDQTSQILDNAIRLADKDVDWTKYTHVYMILPSLSGGCGWAGLATVGCGTITSPSKGRLQMGYVWHQNSRSYMLRESTHELGHNFGLGHSRSVSFPGDSLAPDRSRAVYVEYGDNFSSMGATDAYHFAAGHKFQLKWFREGEHFKTITANTQADLQPMTTQDPGLKALRARRNSGRPNEYVWIEYRQPVSFDARMSSNGWRGALLHIEAAETGRYAEAIDLSPQAAGLPGDSFNDIVLTPGRTWSDPYSDLTVSVTAATADALSVSVTYDKPCVTVAWPASSALTPGAQTFSGTANPTGDCQLNSTGNNYWLTPDASGSTRFKIDANDTPFPRAGSVTLARQTRSLAQAAVKIAPAIDFLSPLESSLQTGIFVPFMIGLSAPNGRSTLGTATFLINATQTNANACLIRYDATLGELSLATDDGASTVATKLRSGSANTMTNKQCSVAAFAIGNSSLTTQTLVFTVSTTDAFAGAKTIYAAVSHISDTTPPALQSQGSLRVATDCQVSFLPARLELASGGGTFSVLADGPSTCAWTAATPSVPWIKVTPASGTGGQRISVVVDPNTDAAKGRSSNVSVKNSLLAVRQTAAGMPVYPQTSFAAVELPLSRTGGSDLVYFSSNLPESALTATSSTGWLRVDPIKIIPIFGPRLAYSWDANTTGEQRKAVVTVAGIPVAFIQDSGSRPGATEYMISTFAGGISDGDGGAARDAFLNTPQQLVYDSDGNLYVAESDGVRIRKITPDGAISTVAGTGINGFSADGTQASAARITNPRGLAFDVKGLLYFTDGTRVRRINADGSLITVAGGGSSVAAEGRANTLNLSGAVGIAFDDKGNLYIADSTQNRIRMVDSAGNATLVAGTGVAGNTGDGADPKLARLSNPQTIAIDPAGALLVADFGNSLIRKIDGTKISTLVSISARTVVTDKQGNVYANDTVRRRIVRLDPSGQNLTSLAGGGTVLPADGMDAATAQPNTLTGLALSPDGRVVFADSAFHTIRTTADGKLATVAGREPYADVGDGGAATSARIFRPQGVAAAPDGSLYVADTRNNRIRKITPDGNISTYAGTGVAGFLGDGGPATAARLNNPIGVAVDASGNVFVSDSFNNRIRKVTPDGKIDTYAGSGAQAFADGPALRASFLQQYGIATDAAGNVYVGDIFNNRVRKISTDGIVTTFAGDGVGRYAGDGGPANKASVYQPWAVAADGAGNVYIVDRTNYRIRVVNADGVISTVAGNGTLTGESSYAANSTLGIPYSMAVDGSGNLFITDGGFDRLYRATPDGRIDRIGGSGLHGADGDSGPAWNGSFNVPWGIAADQNGNVYVADQQNNRIRILTPR